jgi:transposase
VGLRACRESQPQKKAWRLANAIVPTWRGGAPSGQSIKIALILSGWSLSIETWTRTDMAPLRGWAARGRRLTAKVPHGRWKTMTFLAALRHDRMMAVIDGESFRTYVAEVLPPTLHPGDIVILDNLGSHTSKAARQLIRSVGAKLLFLPKYSPDLNPSEQVFAKLKHLVRKARRSNRRHRMRRNRRSPSSLHTRRMRQLSQKLRLPNLISSRFSAWRACPRQPFAT